MVKNRVAFLWILHKFDIFLGKTAKICKILQSQSYSICKQIFNTKEREEKRMKRNAKRIVAALLASGMRWKCDTPSCDAICIQN